MAQSCLLLIWVSALAAYIVQVLTDRLSGVRWPATVATAIAPILEACLVLVQKRWASDAERPYQETGQLLVGGKIRPDLRSQAKDALSAFQIQAKPLFARGRKSEVYALVLFISGFIVSLALVLFLR
jgi:hypothetical protein